MSTKVVTEGGSMIFRKAHTFMKVTRAFQNWPLFIANRYKIGLRNGCAREIRLRNGITFEFSFGSSELGGVAEVWCDDIYSRHFDVRDGDVVIDIGANIGAYSVYAGASGKRVRVLSYEPTPDVEERLRKNVDANNLRGRVTCNRKAVAATRGNRQLMLDAGGSCGNALINEATSNVGNRIEVEAITLGDVFSDNRIDRCDILKMDCEGAEYEILLGASAELLAKIQKMVIEYHHGPDLILKRLRDCEFTVHQEAIDKDRGLIWALR